MFDRVGLSHKYASLTYMTIADSLGVNPRDLTCSSLTMFRYRERYRVEAANEIKDNFDPADMTTIHWDGKTYTKRGQIKDKKRAVVLSNSKQAKLLDVANVADGRAQTHMLAIRDVIENWSVAEHITAMSFDTEGVNSGHIRGVCRQLEHEIERELLHLPCRHQIYELPLSAVFEKTLEKFSKIYFGPNFDKKNYDGCRLDPFFIKLLGFEEMDNIVVFATNKLSETYSYFTIR